MTFTLDGENLLNEQRGEPDNVTVLPGRTLSAGLRLRF
jgi:iron complex outermembrane receptor protein